MARVAIIGSFRTVRYAGVLKAFDVFRDGGFDIVSPAGSEIAKDDEFVRFSTDDPKLSDPGIQSLTLEKIFSADAVYVVASEGYVGKTTCYEIGRIIQRRQPIFFSEAPRDLPVQIPDWCVVTAQDFVLRFADQTRFEWLFSRDSGDLFDVERRLAPP